MNNLFAKRGIIWLTLIALLVALSYFAQFFFIRPLNEEIVALEQQRLTAERDLIMVNNKIKIFNEGLYQNETIEDFIPSSYNFEEVTRKYMERIAYNSDVVIIDKSLSFDVALPENLDFNENIKAISVTLQLDVETIEEFNSFIDELYKSKRAIYISSFSYNLPTEADYLSGDESPSDIQIQYYLFYYDAEE
ncbi:hypothetical protein [Haloplasma contractile]|uniref:Uncharacterized protein n=1 Tax=Haloplasma contractile SSD-17B TaxID=1033810 RepID=U2EGQ3_9MOLU|nr:hypothetical protein [Haloplasma contractile]ERJ13796.1 hypothetical protein HLPCO_000462 [Haloplasma contractile SSD-17B]